MKKLEKYTGTKTYMYPNGTVATPEDVKSRFSAVMAFTHVVETDEAGEVLFALENLSALKSMHGIDISLPEDEAIKAIEDIINTPPPPPEIDATERIAAALKFNNLLIM